MGNAFEGMRCNTTERMQASGRGACQSIRCAREVHPKQWVDCHGKIRIRVELLLVSVVFSRQIKAGFCEGGCYHLETDRWYCLVIAGLATFFLMRSTSLWKKPCLTCNVLH